MPRRHTRDHGAGTSVILTCQGSKLIDLIETEIIGTKIDLVSNLDAFEEGDVIYSAPGVCPCLSPLAERTGGIVLGPDPGTVIHDIVERHARNAVTRRPRDIHHDVCTMPSTSAGSRRVNSHRSG